MLSDTRYYKLRTITANTISKQTLRLSFSLSSTSSKVLSGTNFIVSFFKNPYSTSNLSN